MRRRPVALALLAVGLLAGCESGVRTATQSDLVEEDAPDEQDVPALTPAQTRLFLRDATLARAEEGREIHLYHAEDGTLAGRTSTPSGGEVPARGTWSVDADGRLCHVWRTRAWDATEAGCFVVYRYGESYVLSAEGSEQPKRYRREAGDAETLL
ncbi:MAG: hypothetical protein ACFBWO_18845 [Paracoccaceae bacterium]